MKKHGEGRNASTLARKQDAFGILQGSQKTDQQYVHHNMEGYFIAKQMHCFSQFALEVLISKFWPKNLRPAGSHYLVFCDVTDFPGWVMNNNLSKDLEATKINK